MVSGGADKIAKVWTLADGKAVATITTPAEIKGVSLSPDGTRLAVAGADNRVRLYDLDGKLREFFPHDGPALAVAYHADGKRIISAGADKAVRIWTPSLIWQASAGGPVRQAVFSPKGDRIISGGDDKKVQVWNAADGKSLLALAAQDVPVTGVSISADGNRVASIGGDKTAKVWTIPAAGAKETPPVVFTLPAPATAVALSPNGQRLAASVLDKANRDNTYLRRCQRQGSPGPARSHGRRALAGVPGRQSHAGLGGPRQDHSPDRSQRGQRDRRPCGRRQRRCHCTATARKRSPAAPTRRPSSGTWPAARC